MKLSFFLLDHRHFRYHAVSHYQQKAERRADMKGKAYDGK